MSKVEERPVTLAKKEDFMTLGSDPKTSEKMVIAEANPFKWQEGQEEFEFNFSKQKS